MSADAAVTVPVPGTRAAAARGRRSPGPAASPPKVGDAAGWAARTVHTIQLPSGQWVKMRIPNLAMLIKGGKIPERLRRIAMREVLQDSSPLPLEPTAATDGQQQPIDEATLGDLYDLYELLVVQAVIEPEVTQEMLADLPQEDLDMLTQIATRETHVDARGVPLGVEPLSRWETFRGEHGCAPDCPSCQKALDVLSTVHVGGV